MWVFIRGSILIHYLAHYTEIQKAIAVSTPFDLAASVQALPKFYNAIFTRSVRKSSMKIQKGIKMPVTIKEIHAIRKYKNLIIKL